MVQDAGNNNKPKVVGKSLLELQWFIAMKQIA
jgi:hypothetical protein